MTAMIGSGGGRVRCAGLVGLALLGLAGCGFTVTSRMVPGHNAAAAGDHTPPPKLDPTMAGETPAQWLQWAGSSPERLDPVAATFLDRARTQKHLPHGGRSGWALAAAAVAWRSLVASEVPATRWSTDPQTRPAATLYREALTLFVSEDARELAAGGKPSEHETPLGTITVFSRSADQRYSAGYFDTFLPTDRLRENGVSPRVHTKGWGVPLVGVRERTRARTREMRFQIPGNDLTVALGSVARFSSSENGTVTMEFDFYDAVHSPDLVLRGKQVPLAADFTAPLARAFGGTNAMRVGIHALFNLNAGFGHDGVYQTGAFDPDRIPVLLLPGLLSSPLVWRNVVAVCLESPEIRKNYQFWYGFFSTGTPLTPSVARLRAQIAALRQAGDPAGTSRASRNMMVIGHSMGGVIARALATDIGNHYWNTLTDQPFSEVAMDPRDRETVRSWFFWPPATDIKKVIFLATPHRGTALADNAFVRLGQSIIELPKTMFEYNRRIVAAGAPVSDNDHLRHATRPFTAAFSHIRTGIDSLAPGAPIFQALASAPLVPGVTTHSLMGDRGRGDTPHSSDGVVGYWSSHLETAESELILPSTHELQHDPGCGIEIRRILLEALRQKNTPVRSPGFAHKR